MHFERLAEAASAAIFEIRNFITQHGSAPALDSIESQMRFIYDSALSNRNPLEMVSKDSSFTYGILSSREFASPDEMEIKKKLDRVTELLSSA